MQRNLDLLPWHDQEILKQVRELGGFYNAHAHLDRAYTLEDRYLRHIGTTPLEASNLPLSVKQNLVGDLHRGEAYTETDLRRRISHALEMQIAYGVTRIDTNIDATPDLPQDGLLAIHVALELKEKYKDKIRMRIAPTPIFGFKDDPRFKRTRWDVFEEAARMCDYVSLLPEKDDFDSESDRDGKIGFKSHIRKGVELAFELGKPVEFHLDQMNIPSERGTERFLEMLEGLDQPKCPEKGPSVWIIHMISPSKYPEKRRAELMEKLLKYNVGVKVCPSAALSMRQLYSLKGLIYNSIARVPELIKMKIPVLLGTDNIADVFVPQGDGDMLTEVKMGSIAVRMAAPSIWAKLASGTRPNDVDITTVGGILYQDRKACVKVGPRGWKPAVE
ncbi:hypothetical protein FJY93_04155 [Candidatus Kaiserbacteria bacterium]|nr:hypothetical protein [Candidatus Kaiserbacteria bacterium]